MNEEKTRKKSNNEIKFGEQKNAKIPKSLKKCF